MQETYQTNPESAGCEMKVNSWRREVERRHNGRKGDFPVGTLLFYGPTDRLATKVVAGVFFSDREGDGLIERWTSDAMDVRLDRHIGREVMAFYKTHGVKRVATTSGLAGCPHEEGIDYPDGEVCPQCPFWATRDRWEVADQTGFPPGPFAN